MWALNKARIDTYSTPIAVQHVLNLPLNEQLQYNNSTHISISV